MALEFEARLDQLIESSKRFLEEERSDVKKTNNSQSKRSKSSEGDPMAIVAEDNNADAALQSNEHVGSNDEALAAHIYCSQLEVELKLKENSLNMMHQSLTQSRESEAKALHQVTVLEMGVATEGEKVQKLQKQMEHMQDLQCQVENQLTAQRDKLRSTVKEIAHHVHIAEEAKNRQDMIEENLARARASWGSLKAKNATASQQNERLASQVEKLQEKEAQMTREFDEIKAALKGTEKKLEQVQQLACDLEEEKKALVETVEVGADALKAVIAELESKKELLRQAKESIDPVQKEIEQLRASEQHLRQLDESVEERIKEELTDAAKIHAETLETIMDQLRTAEQRAARAEAQTLMQPQTVGKLEATCKERDALKMRVKTLEAAVESMQRNAVTHGKAASPQVQSSRKSSSRPRDGGSSTKTSARCHHCRKDLGSLVHTAQCVVCKNRFHILCADGYTFFERTSWTCSRC